MSWPGEPRSVTERMRRDLLWTMRRLAHGVRRRAQALLGRARAGRQASGSGTRLHLGCGAHHLDGWLNIDIDPLPGVDVVRDVTRGLPWRDVELVYAEHFLEHLAIEQALELLVEIHRVLRPDGLLRLTTPSLDWIRATHLSQASSGLPALATLHANRAFYAWGHRFLWSRSLLQEALEGCGFSGLEWCRYGESSHRDLAGLEAHETYNDAAELPHVLVVECRRAAQAPEQLDRLQQLVQDELLHHMAPADAPRPARREWWADRKRRRQG